MKRILLTLIFFNLLICLVNAQNNINGLSSSNVFIHDPDFWLSVSVNLAGTGLFITRVHHPPSAKWFGYSTQLLGIPSLTLGIIDISQGTTDFTTWANMGYAAWALGAAMLDHVFKVEYRDPVKPGILIPYVAGYYITITLQAAAQLQKGVLPWVIAGGICIINVAASFYSHFKGADYNR